MSESINPLRSLFLDMDSYFASVEQYLRPELRNKAVGVAPMLVESTCCIAASYEAKAFGVKTGTRVSDARKLCPAIEIVHARPSLYVEVHHRIVEIVESCIHVDHVLSIDEMLCWLPLNWRTDEKINGLEREIKMKLDAEFDGVIRCSIGIAPNGWLAKVVSKMKKPNGFVVVKQSDLPEILYTLNLDDLHGVGRNMEARLHANEIHTVEQLCSATKDLLKGVWGGVEGSRLWHKLRGDEINDIDSSPMKKSIGHGHVLPPEFRPQDKAISVIHRLVQKAAQRARSYGLMIGAINLSLKYTNYSKWEQGLSFSETSDCLFLTNTVKAIWKMRADKRSTILKVNVVLHRLVADVNHTPSLFNQHKANHYELNKVMDSVVNQFGKEALYLGGAHGAMHTGKPKIAFQHIPDLKTES